MKNMKLVVAGLAFLTVASVTGCDNSSDNNGTDNVIVEKAFAYAGTVEGRLYDTVYMSDVTYYITINPDGYTYGKIMFGATTVLMEFEGTTTSDGNFTAVDKNRGRNDLGMRDVGPVVMDGTMVTTDGHVNGGSGHWYSDNVVGNWHTPSL